MNAFERIVEEDPEGVEEVRRHLEDWFPRLADVATSSMGASVGPYMGELEVALLLTRVPACNVLPILHSYAQVTPMQLTRAFLVQCNSNRH